MNNLRHRATILDEAQMARVMRRMAGEIVEHNEGVGDLLLVGIRTRGVPLAEHLQSAIEKLEGVRPPLGVLDITLYRDDLATVAEQPVVRESHLPQLEGRRVVLCDDVLYTGRTTRAAIDALMDYGRPKSVQLAVLVDRGRRYRELPVQADYVGEEVSTRPNEVVKVRFAATDDGHQDVSLQERQEAE